jgi:UDP-N-acetylbacillosamine N-acetyltransferase
MTKIRKRSRRARNILLWGAGGHAAFVEDIVRLVFPGLRVVFGVDSNAGAGNTKSVCRGWQKALKAMGGAQALFLPAMGSSVGRFRAVMRARRAGLTSCRALHPCAVVAAGAEIGDSVVAGPASVIGARVVVGEGSIVNSGAIIEHDCDIGEFAHVSPGAVLCGRAKVGGFTWIGAGAVLMPAVKIGAGAMVGAGALVTRDVGPGEVVAGNPARHLRKSSPRDPWFLPPDAAEAIRGNAGRS